MKINKKEIEMIVTGSMKWNEFRDKIVKDLKNCKTEKDFTNIMIALLYSASESEEEMQEKRSKWGIPET